jgi:hypothetical protein
LGKEFCDGLLERVRGSGFGGAQQLLELCPGFLDGVEVGRVGWEREQFCSGGCDSLAYACDLVRAEVVHDHHIARSQCWTENVVEVSEEYLGVGCASMVIVAIMPRRLIAPRMVRIFQLPSGVVSCTRTPRSALA